MNQNTFSQMFYHLREAYLLVDEEEKKHGKTSFTAMTKLTLDMLFDKFAIRSGVPSGYVEEWKAEIDKICKEIACNDIFELLNHYKIADGTGIKISNEA